MIPFFSDSKPFSRNKAVIFVVISAILWSTNGLFIKMIDLGPLTIVGVRSAIAAVMMVAIYNKNLRFNWSFPQIAGALAYSATVIAFVSATKMTTAANVVFLHYSTPAFTALLGAWLLKERVSRFDWGIIAVALGGMALFFLDEFTPGGFWGNIIAIGSAITVAFMILFLRQQKSGSPLETIILGNIFTVVICSFFFFQEPPTTGDWFPLLYMGTIQIGLSFILYCSAIKYIAALDAVLAQTIEPILNPIWVLLIIGETPGVWAVIGGVVVLTAVTVRNIHTNRKYTTKRPAAI
ncbi:MAG: EamA family transporter [Bacillota bacterium]|nr:EamA family transporter [Bacillota bacterium]